MTTNVDVEFSRTELRVLRDEAKATGTKIPKGMTALKVGMGDWYLVEGRGGFRLEVCAHNAYDAKCEAIKSLLPRESELSPR
jgi:hypothetical protein